MTKILLNIFPLLAILLVACSENDGPDAPGTPPAPIVDSESGLVVSFTGKHHRLCRDVDFQGSVNQNWTDTVWCNDRVHNQLVLKATMGKVDNLRFDISPLAGRDFEIPSENIRLRGVKMVAGDAAPSVDAQPQPRPVAYVGDALVDERPAAVEPGDIQAVWITINIPAECQPGSYTGSVDVSTGDKLIASCKITVLVTPHRLPMPSEWNFHLDIWQFPFQLPMLIEQNGGGKVEMFSSKYFDLMRPFYTLLADAGQKTITAYIKDGAFNKGQTMVDWTRKTDGSWSFDYSHFDKYVEFMDQLGIDRQISCFSLAGWNNTVGYTDASDGNTYKYMDLSIGSDEFDKIWTSFLVDFRSHLQSKGWFDRAVLFMDENTNDEIRRIVNLIRKNGSDWKIGFSGRYIDADVEREFYNYAAIIGTPISSTAIDFPVFYTSCSQIRPNNFVTPINSPAEMTWMAWHALAKGFKGYQRWAFDYWTRPDVFDARDRANTAGDFHMIYRSDNTAEARPVSSIRWELLREGLQDYEKARILGVHKLRAVIAPFKAHEAAEAPAIIAAAQAKLKELSAK